MNVVRLNGCAGAHSVGDCCALDTYRKRDPALDDATKPSNLPESVSEILDWFERRDRTPSGAENHQTHPPLAPHTTTTVSQPSSLALAATGGDDGWLRLWDLDQHKEISSVRLGVEGNSKHLRPIRCLSFSPCGRMLAVAVGGAVTLGQAIPRGSANTVAPEAKAIIKLVSTASAALTTVTKGGVRGSDLRSSAYISICTHV